MGATGAPGCRAPRTARAGAGLLVALLLTLAPAASAQEATTTSLSGPTTAMTGIYVQFTITLTVANPGPPMPSGTLQVLDNGAPIPECSYTPPVTAPNQINCTTRFSSPGTHQVTARYTGDGNFAGSTSPVVTVKVSPPPPRIGPVDIQTTSPTTAKLVGGIVNVAIPVKWRFQFGTTPRYGHATPLRTAPANKRTTVTLSSLVGHLKPGTRYHVRLVLTTPYVTVMSPDRTFKTPRRAA